MLKTFAHRSAITVLTGFSLVAISPNANAADLTGSYTFINESPNAIVTTDNPSDVTFSDWQTAAGRDITYYAGTPDKALGSKDWVTDPTTNYFWFEVGANAGRTLSFNQISFDSRRSATGPASWELTAQVGDATPISLSTGGNSTSWNTITIDSLSNSLSDIADSIVFRLYGTDASNKAGTWRIDNFNLVGSVNFANSLISNGNPGSAAAQTPGADPVPTPALIPAIGLLALKLRKRIKAA